MIGVDRELLNTFDNIKKDTKLLTYNHHVMYADQSITGVLNKSEDYNKKKYSQNSIGIEGDIYMELKRYAETHPEVSYVYVGTAWGGFVQWPDGVPVNGYDPRQRFWYQDALKVPDDVILTAPYISLDEKQSLIVTTSSALKDINGNIVGVVGMDIALERISDLVNKIKIGDSGYLVLYTADGTIITHPNSSLIFKNLKDLVKEDDVNKRSIYRFVVESPEKLFSGEKESFETLVNNSPVLVNTYTSPSTGWKMASIVEKRELTNQANTIGFYIVIITLAIIAFAIIIADFASSKISKPLKDITSLMMEAGNGNLAVQSKINTKDEFGQLSSSFNSMINKLSISYDELTSVHEELIATDEELRAQYDELQSNEEALRNSEERYRLAVAGANDVIWEWNLETGDFFASEKWYDITGYRAAGALTYDRMIKEILHPEDVDSIVLKFQEHLEGKDDFFKAEFRIRMKRGNFKWVYCRGKALKSYDGISKKMAGSMTDISDRKKTEEKIQHMAYFDSLTDLPNRVLLMKTLKTELAKAVEENSQGALFFIDLDNFKNINDTLGHDYGDKLLIELSNKLKTFKRHDDTVFRFSGDEFIILHPFLNNESLLIYAEELLQIFSNPLQIEEKQVHITSSVGISLYPKHGTEASTLLKNADTAMYKAKELGKSTYTFYNDEMYLKLQRKTNIESVLRTAIENNEFTLLYQPQYDITHNSICGFEALLRLHSKELGFISPAEFIPIAEETGHIVDIGRWVLRAACTKAAQWRNSGFDFACMGVNISTIQIQHPGFIDMVSDIIDETGIAPHDLELEITETVLMKSLDSNIDILNDLRSMGIRIALDDFGTGYSSLNYLKKIPITTLKVDKSFIDNLCCSNKEKAIIESIIQMAHHMELKVVAEGVETTDQLEVLKSKYCDKVQGYLFSKPLPESDAERLMR
jgi:diguanylate cyclase (GGDEF)-like protein/PAS domain S-box-containing protein